MPNWCNNSIYISGRPENVKSFVDEMQELYLQYQDNHKPNGNGLMVKPEYCKDIDGNYFNLECGSLEDYNFPEDWYNYTTRWSPNLEVLKRMAIRHMVIITCEYEELGCLVFGRYTYNAETGEEFEVNLDDDDFDKFEQDEDTFICTFRGETYESEYEILETLLDEKEAAISAKSKEETN